jgi:hypothetical protein
MPVEKLREYVDMYHNFLAQSRFRLVNCHWNNSEATYVEAKATIEQEVRDTAVAVEWLDDLYAERLQCRDVELAALRAWRDAVVPVLRDITIPSVLSNAEESWCGVCLSLLDGATCSNPTCPITRARALLAQTESEGRDAQAD